MPAAHFGDATRGGSLRAALGSSHGGPAIDRTKITEPSGQRRAAVAATEDEQIGIVVSNDLPLSPGSDHPHLEGTFPHPDGADMPSAPWLSLHNTFFREFEEDKTFCIVGKNATQLFNFDREVHTGIAREVYALTATENAVPIDIGGNPRVECPRAFRAGPGLWA
jgi:hypothetical protein